MKIVAPAITNNKDSQISDRFGRSAYFVLYDTETKDYKIIENPYLNNQGGVGIKTAELIINIPADILITPRVGEKAMRLFADSKMDIYLCKDLTVSQNIQAYLNGELEDLN